MAYNPAGADTALAAGTIPAPVDSKYCVPYVTQFVVDQKIMTLSSGKFKIRDSEGKLLFDVKGKFPRLLHTKRILRDASGKTIALLKKKIMTMHDRWAVYRGDDDSERNLLFTMGKTSMYQFTPSFDIYLAGNRSGRPDFKVRGNIFELNFAILYHKTPVAEVRKMMNVSSLVLGKDQYGVTVFAGVDHAFIAAVIVIIDQVKQDDMKNQED